MLLDVGVQAKDFTSFRPGTAWLLSLFFTLFPSGYVVHLSSGGSTAAWAVTPVSRVGSVIPPLTAYVVGVQLQQSLTMASGATADVQTFPGKIVAPFCGFLAGF